jgi:hypothetical protein
MKRIHEIGVYKSGDLRVEVVDLNDLQETVEENTAVFVGHTTVTSRIRGEDSSDRFHITRAYLKQQARWRIIASQNILMARPNARVGNHVRRIAA